MKTIKQLMLSFGIIGLVLFLSIGGCKKELSSDSTKLNNADLLMSKEAGPGKKKVLRQSPGLKFEVKSKTIERLSPTLKSIDKITAILNEEQSKKNQGGVMTTKSVNFTTSLAGTYYNCYAELNDPGPYDWYLINWYTGVYTYIGSSTDYINFNVQKPSMYGSYRVWGEGPYGAGFTGYQYMGDSYSGVSINSGILSFTNQAAYDATKDRLKNAEEVHLEWLNQFDSYTDDAADVAAENAGFDDNLPFKEFEAHFGLSSLRAKIQGEVDYWLSQSHADFAGFPEDNYFPYSAAELTLMTNESQVEIGGVGEGPFTVPTYALAKIPQSYGSNTCMAQTNIEQKIPYATGLRVKMDVGVIYKTNGTIFYTRSKSYKHTAGGTFWKQKRQPHRTKVYGTYYNANCASPTAFDSGFSNTGNHKRSKEEAEFPIYITFQSTKSGELYGATVISNYSSTPITLQYTH